MVFWHDRRYLSSSFSFSFLFLFLFFFLDRELPNILRIRETVSGNRG